MKDFEIGDFAANRAMSRLEARLALELAVEARFPKYIARKLTITDTPLDLYMLHQSVLRLGGYRRVEQENIFKDVAMLLGIDVAGNSSSIKTIQEAFSMLHWIEDEVPSTLVQDLQAAASERSPLSFADDSIPQNLIGGTIADLPEWFHSQYIDGSLSHGSFGLPPLNQNDPVADVLHKIITESDDVVSRKLSLPSKASSRESGFESLHADEVLPIDNSTSSAISHVVAEGMVERQVKDKVSKRGKTEKSSDSASLSSSSKTPHLSSRRDGYVPSYIVPLDTRAHANDAICLYKLHPFGAQMAGAIFGGFPPHALTEEEEVAFPMYSRASEVHMQYSKSERRDIERQSQHVFVLSSTSNHSKFIVGFAHPSESKVKSRPVVDCLLPTSHLFLPTNTANFSEFRNVGMSGSKYGILGESSTETNEMKTPHLLPKSVVSPDISYLKGFKLNSTPVAPRFLVHTESYLEHVLPQGCRRFDLDKKTLIKNEKLAARLSLMLVDEEPWVGQSVGRMAFYLDIRNHILLKWLQSQSSHLEGESWSVGLNTSNIHLSRRAELLQVAAEYFSVFGDDESFFSSTSTTASLPSTSSATISLNSSGSGDNAKRTSDQQASLSWQACISHAFEQFAMKSTYSAPPLILRTKPRTAPIGPQMIGPFVRSRPGSAGRLPLSFREVVRFVPRRLHESVAATFDFLEGYGHVNVGALESFSVDLDEQQQLQAPGRPVVRVEHAPFFQAVKKILHSRITPRMSWEQMQRLRLTWREIVNVSDGSGTLPESPFAPPSLPELLKISNSLTDASIALDPLSRVDMGPSLKPLTETLPASPRSTWKRLQSPGPFRRRRIVVVGAGAAGLAAAKQLSTFGHNVVVVEALDSLGGRSRTDYSLGVPLDLGLSTLTQLPLSAPVGGSPSGLIDNSAATNILALQARVPLARVPSSSNIPLLAAARARTALLRASQRVLLERLGAELSSRLKAFRESMIVPSLATSGSSESFSSASSASAAPLTGGEEADKDAPLSDAPFEPHGLLQLLRQEDASNTGQGLTLLPSQTQSKSQSRLKKSTSRARAARPGDTAAGAGPTAAAKAKLANLNVLISYYSQLDSSLVPDTLDPDRDYLPFQPGAAESTGNKGSSTATNNANSNNNNSNNNNSNSNSNNRGRPKKVSSSKSLNASSSSNSSLTNSSLNSSSSSSKSLAEDSSVRLVHGIVLRGSLCRLSDPTVKLAILIRDSQRQIALLHLRFLSQLQRVLSALAMSLVHDPDRYFDILGPDAAASVGLSSRPTLSGTYGILAQTAAPGEPSVRLLAAVDAEIELTREWLAMPQQAHAELVLRQLLEGTPPFMGLSRLRRLAQGARQRQQVSDLEGFATATSLAVSSSSGMYIYGTGTSGSSELRNQLNQAQSAAAAKVAKVFTVGTGKYEIPISHLLAEESSTLWPLLEQPGHRQKPTSQKGTKHREDHSISNVNAFGSTLTDAVVALPDVLREEADRTFSEMLSKTIASSMFDQPVSASAVTSLLFPLLRTQPYASDAKDASSGRGNISKNSEIPFKELVGSRLRGALNPKAVPVKVPLSPVYADVVGSQLVYHSASAPLYGVVPSFSDFEAVDSYFSSQILDPMGPMRGHIESPATLAVRLRAHVRLPEGAAFGQIKLRQKRSRIERDLDFVSESNFSRKGVDATIVLESARAPTRTSVFVNGRKTSAIPIVTSFSSSSSAASSSSSSSSSSVPTSNSSEEKSLEAPEAKRIKLETSSSDDSMNTSSSNDVISVSTEDEDVTMHPATAPTVEEAKEVGGEEAPTLTEALLFSVQHGHVLPSMYRFFPRHPTLLSGQGINFVVYDVYPRLQAPMYPSDPRKSGQRALLESGGLAASPFLKFEGEMPVSLARSSVLTEAALHASSPFSPVSSTQKSHISHPHSNDISSQCIDDLDMFLNEDEGELMADPATASGESPVLLGGYGNGFSLYSRQLNLLLGGDVSPSTESLMIALGHPQSPLKPLLGAFCPSFAAPMDLYPHLNLSPLPSQGIAPSVNRQNSGFSSGLTGSNSTGPGSLTGITQFGTASSLQTAGGMLPPGTLTHSIAVLLSHHRLLSIAAGVHPTTAINSTISDSSASVLNTKTNWDTAVQNISSVNRSINENDDISGRNSSTLFLPASTHFKLSNVPKRAFDEVVSSTSNPAITGDFKSVTSEESGAQQQLTAILRRSISLRPSVPQLVHISTAQEPQTSFSSPSSFQFSGSLSSTTYLNPTMAQSGPSMGTVGSRSSKFTGAGSKRTGGSSGSGLGSTGGSSTGGSVPTGHSLAMQARTIQLYPAISASVSVPAPSRSTSSSVSSSVPPGAAPAVYGIPSNSRKMLHFSARFPQLPSVSSPTFLFPYVPVGLPPLLTAGAFADLELCGAPPGLELVLTLSHQLHAAAVQGVYTQSGDLADSFASKGALASALAAQVPVFLAAVAQSISTVLSQTLSLIQLQATAEWLLKQCHRFLDEFAAEHGFFSARDDRMGLILPSALSRDHQMTGRNPVVRFILSQALQTNQEGLRALLRAAAVPTCIPSEIRPAADISLGTALEWIFSVSRDCVRSGRAAAVRLAANTLLSGFLPDHGQLSSNSTTNKANPLLQRLLNSTTNEKSTLKALAAVAGNLMETIASDSSFLSEEGTEMTVGGAIRSLVRWHVQGLEALCGAPVHALSAAQAARTCARATAPQSFVPEGMGSLLSGLTEGVDIMYGVEATTVNWDTEVHVLVDSTSGEHLPVPSNLHYLIHSFGSEGSKCDKELPLVLQDVRIDDKEFQLVRTRGVRVGVRPTAENGKSKEFEIEADAVVLTVPLGVLQEGRPRFVPSLPQWKKVAIDSLGVGLTNKVALRFPYPFWRSISSHSQSPSSVSTNSNIPSYPSPQQESSPNSASSANTTTTVEGEELPARVSHLVPFISTVMQNLRFSVYSLDPTGLMKAASLVLHVMDAGIPLNYRAMLVTCVSRHEQLQSMIQKHSNFSDSMKDLSENSESKIVDGLLAAENRDFLTILAAIFALGEAGNDEDIAAQLFLYWFAYEDSKPEHPPTGKHVGRIRSSSESSSTPFSPSEVVSHPASRTEDHRKPFLPRPDYLNSRLHQRLSEGWVRNVGSSLTAARKSFSLDAFLPEVREELMTPHQRDLLALLQDPDTPIAESSSSGTSSTSATNSSQADEPPGSISALLKSAQWFTQASRALLELAQSSNTSDSLNTSNSSVAGMKDFIEDGSEFLFSKEAAVATRGFSSNTFLFGTVSTESTSISDTAVPEKQENDEIMEGSTEDIHAEARALLAASAQRGFAGFVWLLDSIDIHSAPRESGILSPANAARNQEVLKAFSPLSYSQSGSFLPVFFSDPSAAPKSASNTPHIDGHVRSLGSFESEEVSPGLTVYLPSWLPANSRALVLRNIRESPDTFTVPSGSPSNQMVPLSSDGFSLRRDNTLSPHSCNEPVLLAVMSGAAAEFVEREEPEMVVKLLVQKLQSIFSLLPTNGINTNPTSNVNSTPKTSSGPSFPSSTASSSSNGTTSGAVMGQFVVPNPTGYVISRWASNRFARGSGSFLPPGADPVLFDLMAAPVGETLFFAGEATSKKMNGSVDGAIDSGIREAVRIAGKYGRVRDVDLMACLDNRAWRLFAYSQD